MTEIIPSHPEKSNSMKIYCGIIALVVAVGAIAFLPVPLPRRNRHEQPKPAAPHDNNTKAATRSGPSAGAGSSRSRCQRTTGRRLPLRQHETAAAIS